MRKSNHKHISRILAFGFAVALILMLGETSDGGCDIAWSLTWLLILVVLGYSWGKLNPDKMNGDEQV